MSTILDALKKVERDRESPRDELLDVERPPPQTRRGIPTRVIIACASIGFAAGIAFALWRDTAPLQQAAVPEPATLPAIEVPPAPPAMARPKRAAANPPAGTEQPSTHAAAGTAPAAPDTAAPAAGIPAPASAPALDTPALVAALPKAARAAAPPAAAAAAPGIAVPPPGAVPASGAGSALEPSPFTAGEQAAPVVPAPPSERRSGHGARRGLNAHPPTTLAPPPPDTVAALAPPPPADTVAALAPAAPPAEAPSLPPPAEPAPAEPAQPPPVVFDTGRSPPGSPQVSLTFLQWSADPDRRFAFISVDGAPSQRVREGDTPNGMTVAQITPTGVQFKREGQLFMIRPRH